MIVHVNWKGPFSLEETYKKTDDSFDYGVYQIYGSHTVYGSNVLVYIGKAVRQTFGTRIKQENWEYNKDSGQLQVYLGRLDRTGITSVACWDESIDIVERMLLLAHSPAKNSQSINRIPEEYSTMHILNLGQYRDLLPEVSGARWAQFFQPRDLRLDYLPDED